MYQFFVSDSKDTPREEVTSYITKDASAKTVKRIKEDYILNRRGLRSPVGMDDIVIHEIREDSDNIYL